MGSFKFFNRAEDPSANIARDRLQVLIAHERSGRRGPDYLPQLKQDILDVIKKYVVVSDDSVSVELDTQDNCDVLELNITLPEIQERKQEQTVKTQPSAEARRRAALRRQVNVS
jgi:cell division topological specificity factor